MGSKLRRSSDLVQQSLILSTQFSEKEAAQ